MTDEELDAVLARRDADIARFRVEYEGDREVRALIAEVRRLRGLIKQAETAAGHYEPYNSVSDGHCPWCDAFGGWSIPTKPHKPGCPAFTPDGSVR